MQVWSRACRTAITKWAQHMYQNMFDIVFNHNIVHPLEVVFRKMMNGGESGDSPMSALFTNEEREYIKKSLFQYNHSDGVELDASDKSLQCPSLIHQVEESVCSVLALFLISYQETGNVQSYGSSPDGLENSSTSNGYEYHTAGNEDPNQIFHKILGKILAESNVTSRVNTTYDDGREHPDIQLNESHDSSVTLSPSPYGTEKVHASSSSVLSPSSGSMPFDPRHELSLLSIYLRLLKKSHVVKDYIQVVHKCAILNCDSD